VKTLEHPSAHPSFLELDRHALGAARTDVAAHLAGCETCRARLAPPAPPAEVPGWARQLGPRRRSWFSWPAAPRRRALGFSVAALAIVALVWTAGGNRNARVNEPGGYVGTKGGPGLWLYVKRGERVALWNGSDPVVPGDLLRLKVQPDRFGHISVFETTGKPGAYERLYDAEIASGQLTAVPVSWKVDARPGAETLVVVLGAESVSPDQVAGLLAGGEDGRHWSRRLVLAKVAGPGSARRDGTGP
jgi:hypothetical protein